MARAAFFGRSAGSRASAAFSTLAVVAAVGGFAATCTASHAADLLDVYQLARRNDPVLAAADAARGAVREGVAIARASLLPQAVAGASFAQTNSPGATQADPPAPSDRNNARTVTASVSQVLVDLSKLAQWKGAQAQADAQDAAYRAAEQALCLRVATAYLGALTAADALATTQANEDAYHQQVDQAESRYRTGLAALVDVNQSRAYYAAARASTVAARTALADAYEALAEITGEPAASLAGQLKSLRDDLPLKAPEPADAQAWVAAAEQHNPALQAQQLTVQAGEQSIAAARAGHLPTLTAGLDASHAAGWPQPLTPSDGRTVRTVGVTLNVPLFAGGATQAQVRQAVRLRDGARDELERQRRQVARQVLGSYRSVVAGIGQIEIDRGAVDAARAALDSTRVGQQLGTQSTTDLLLAIQTLTSAQNAYSQVRHQFVLDQLLLQQGAGSVNEVSLAAVNALLE